LREYFDTSVLVAVFWGGHARHEASIQLFASADKKHSACGVHSLAEVYAIMSVLPVKPMIPAEQVFLFVEEVRARLTLVSLQENEYFETIRNTAAKGLTGGKIYDALVLRCAEKCKAETIYTWNLKHFRSIAPGLADRVSTP
jgi:predicted nucleic acid-binding protein